MEKKIYDLSCIRHWEQEKICWHYRKKPARYPKFKFKTMHTIRHSKQKIYSLKL